jgi:hypothetical protein
MTSTNHEDVSFRGHTIGVLKLNNSTSIATEVIDNYNCYIDYLMELGFMISEMDIPNYEEIIAAYQMLTPDMLLLFLHNSKWIFRIMKK